jgi:hypothetical protein
MFSRKMVKGAGAGVLLGAVLITSACGGQSQADKRVQELSGLTHTQFVTKLDNFCAEGDGKDDKAKQRELERAFEAEDYRHAADLLDDALGEAEDKLDKFREIEPPATDRASFTAYGDAVEDGVVALDTFVDALRSDDGPEFTTMIALGEKLDGVKKRTNAAVEEIGATECVDA